eukprot:UC4_evm3s1308
MAAAGSSTQPVCNNSNSALDRLLPVKPNTRSHTHKTLYLVRHAESEENVKVRAVTSGWNRTRRFRGFFTPYELLQGIRLLACNTNAKLSQAGELQLIEQRRRIDAQNFSAQSVGAEVIVHSPLIRAKRTAYRLFVEGFDKSQVQSPTPVYEIRDLTERKPYEYIFNGPFNNRISRLITWLQKRPEQCLIIVGHGQFFKRMLGVEWKFRNVDIFKTDFEVETGSFSNIELLYRSELSDSSEAKA